MRYLSITFTLLFALSTSVGLAYGQSTEINRTDLKQMYLEGLDYPVGLQDVEWGPFIGGGSLRIQYEYIPPQSGSQYLRGSSPACVQIDRGDMVRASYLIDAFYECEQQGSCQALPSYSDVLFSTSSEQELPLIEEFDTTLAPGMSNWTLQRSHALNWLDAVQGVILGLQTHEFAHALLHRDSEMDADLEAEADGFSAYVREIARIEVNPRPGQTYSLSSTALVLTQFVNAERSYELAQGTHPPSECRIEAAMLGLANWYDQRPNLVPPQEFSPQEVRPFLRTALEAFLPQRAGLCNRYSLGFDRGVRVASRTISLGTDISFNFEGFNRRCDVNSR